MGSKKIIVPQGLINPNETTIIEIPSGVDSEATLIARSGSSEFIPCSNSKSKSKSPSKSGLMITKVTSTTVFEGDDDSKETETPRRNKNMYMSSQASSYQDQSIPRSTRYQQSYLEQHSSGYEMYRPSGRAATQSTPKTVCDEPSCPAVKSMLGPRKSVNSNPSYLNTQPTYSQNQAGVVSYSPRFTNDSSYYGESQMGYQSPRPRVKKIIRKVVTETPSYSAQTTARYQSARDVSRFSPVMSSTARNEEPSDPAPAPYSCTQCTRTTCDPKQSNLKSQVERHLAEIEESERQKINRDLAIFQQARRRLVEDATNISSGESSLPFPKN